MPLYITTFQSSPVITCANYTPNIIMITTEKMKFSIEDFFGKCDQIRSSCGLVTRIWSHLLKESVMENFTFCAAYLQNQRVRVLPK